MSCHVGSRGEVRERDRDSLRVAADKESAAWRHLDGADIAARVYGVGTELVTDAWVRVVVGCRVRDDAEVMNVRVGRWVASEVIAAVEVVDLHDAVAEHWCFIEVDVRVLTEVLYIVSDISVRAGEREVVCPECDLARVEVLGRRIDLVLRELPVGDV
ncbi:hypothetical protein CCP3SC15_1440001 [Gammaproteobacteria bacterium]